jgi:hypothetical protein
MAFLISLSKTNCLASILIACLIAFLRIGPERFLTTLPRIFLFSSTFSSTIFPVNKKAIEEICLQINLYHS